MRSNLFFKHDLYAVQNDRELRHVCRQYPVWGEAVFFSAVTMLYRADGEPYLKDYLVEDICEALFTDNDEKVRQIIDELILHNLLICEGNPERITSRRVCEECEKQRVFRQKQKEKGLKSGQARAKQNATGGSTTVQPRLSNGSTAAEPINKTKTKTKNNNDTLSSISRHAPENDPVPYSEIIGKWNEMSTKSGLPAVTTKSDKRRDAMRTCWAEFGERVYEAIGKVAESDYLTGRSGKWYGCGFDWLFVKNNMIKVLEGNYANRAPGKRNTVCNDPGRLNASSDGNGGFEL